MMPRRPTRSVAVLLVALTAFLTVGALATVASVSSAGAQTPSPTTTIVPLDDQPLESPSIIPAPNSTSQKPQYLVMGAIVVGLGVMVLLIVRESRRKSANRTHKPA